MKTSEELNSVKEEVKAMDKKPENLTEVELKQVTGGEGAFSVIGMYQCPFCKQKHEFSIKLGGCGLTFDKTLVDCDLLANIQMTEYTYTGNPACPVIGTVNVYSFTHSDQYVQFTSRIG